MSTLLFVAEITGSPETGYAASFPDLASCSVRAGDLAELLTKSRGAILGCLQRLSDEGEAWPTPTPIDQIPQGLGTITTLVDVSVDDPPVRANISIGGRLLERLDAAAEARGMTRSGFISQAVLVSLGEKPASMEFDAVGHRIQDELTALGRKINDSIGPESPFSRRMTELDDRLYDGVRKAADSVSAAMVKRRSQNGASEGKTADAGPKPLKWPQTEDHE